VGQQNARQSPLSSYFKLFFHSTTRPASFAEGNHSKERIMRVRAVFSGVIPFALLCFVSGAMAQDAQIAPGSERPMFTRFRGQLHTPKNSIEAATTPLQTWNGTFNYGGTNYTYNMVGTAPTSGASTTVQVKIIPIKIVITGKGRGATTSTFDPAHVLSNGKSVTTNTVQSPVFTPILFTSGGVSMGTTQYIDAYQRQFLGNGIQSHGVSLAAWRSYSCTGANPQSSVTIRQNWRGVWLQRGVSRYQLVRLSASYPYHQLGHHSEHIADFSDLQRLPHAK
jgi:hypothetical protein